MTRRDSKVMLRQGAKDQHPVIARPGTARRRCIVGRIGTAAAGLAALCMLMVTALSVRAEAPESHEPVSPWKLEFSKTFPFGVALPGESGQYTLTVENHSDKALAGTVTMDIQVPGEEVEKREKWSVDLEPGKSKALTWTAPTDAPGYQVLTAVAKDSEGNELGRTVSGLLVTGEPLSPSLPPEDSFFATMITQNPVAVGRAGVRVDRVTIAWPYIQPDARGAYNWEKYDRKINERLDQGVGIILDLRPTGGERIPKGVEWTSCEELSKEEYLPEFGEFIRTVVEHYRGKILAVEIMNEPNLMCKINATGDISAAKIYAPLLKEAYRVSKSVDPDLPVIGLSIAGGMDFPEMPFSREVMELAPGSMDIMGGHTYTPSGRSIGAGYRSLSPLKSGIREYYQLMIDFMIENDLEPRIWSTELGWKVYEHEPYSSKAMRLYGAYTAQALTMVRAIPEVEKQAWFAFQYPGFEQSCSYGMFRKLDGRAKPLLGGEFFPTASAAAYATCARFLDDVIFIEEFKLGTMVYGFRFRNETAGDDVFVLWVDDPYSTGGSARLALSPEAPTPSLIADAFGREIAPSGTLSLDPLPWFVVVPSDEGEAYMEALEEADMRASEGLSIERPAVTHENEITIGVSNNTPRPIPAKIYLQEESSSAPSLLLQPGVEVRPIEVHTPLDTPVRTQMVILNESNGEQRSVDIEFYLHSLPRLDAAGDLERLAEYNAPALVLDQREQVLPPDPYIDWNGPEDLSVLGWAGWTQEGVALLLKVTDDTFIITASELQDVWRADSVQVAFDMSNRAAYGYDEGCYEYSIGQGETDLIISSNFGPSGTEGIQADITRKGTLTTYRMFFPWKAMGGKPLQAGDVFRMNFIVNENDGQGRECWIGPAPGIGEEKQPASFPQWVLR